MPSVRLLRAALLLVGAPVLAAAQRLPAASLEIDVVHDSGLVRNAETEGGPRVLASFPVQVEGARWLRLHFDTVELAGSRERRDASFLRLTSMHDGCEQRLDALALRQWRQRSAYFNGDAVLVELVGYPGTGDNRFVLDKTAVGLPPQETLCGADDRVPSDDPRVARLMPAQCTGWIVDDACGCFLTAGHCAAEADVAQFHVPPSNLNGTINHPSPDHQYALDPSSVQASGDGTVVGQDYGYLGFFPNPNTGLTPREAQGAGFALAAPPAFQPGQALRVTGFGGDVGTANQTEQTHVGPRVASALPHVLEYMADTTGGSSGSPLVLEATGEAIGIHTHGGCTAIAGNLGTSLLHPGLQAFLASPQGVCVPPPCGVVARAVLALGAGLNPPCVATLAPPVLGGTWTVAVDASVTPGATGTLLHGREGGTSGLLLAIGELLVDLTTPFVFQTQVVGGGLTLHEIPVPHLSELAGLQLTVQGITLVGAGLGQLCNGETVTVGCR